MAFRRLKQLFCLHHYWRVRSVSPVKGYKMKEVEKCTKCGKVKRVRYY